MGAKGLVCDVLSGISWSSSLCFFLSESNIPKEPVYDTRSTIFKCWGCVTDVLPSANCTANIFFQIYTKHQDCIRIESTFKQNNHISQRQRWFLFSFGISVTVKYS